MDNLLHFVNKNRLERTAAALKKHRMEVYIAESAKDVVPIVEKLIKQGETIGKGGSVTLEQCGVTSLLKSGNYNYLDLEKTDDEGRRKMMRQNFLADTYFTSANAITEDGYIYQIDGRSNRIAAIAYGPDQVVIVAGVNKITPDRPSARQRIRDISAPANAYRLNCKTPCAENGKCTDCSSPDRICCNELIMGPQREQGRIKVILVCEDLGL